MPGRRGGWAAGRALMQPLQRKGHQPCLNCADSASMAPRLCSCLSPLASGGPGLGQCGRRLQDGSRWLPEAPSPVHRPRPSHSQPPAGKRRGLGKGGPQHSLALLMLQVLHCLSAAPGPAQGCTCCLARPRTEPGRAAPWLCSGSPRGLRAASGFDLGKAGLLSEQGGAAATAGGEQGGCCRVAARALQCRCSHRHMQGCPSQGQGQEGHL